MLNVIIIDDDCIFTVEEQQVDGYKYVHIQNMWVWRKFNMLKLRKILRDRYPGAIFYWFSKRRKVPVYTRNPDRRIG